MRHRSAAVARGEKDGMAAQPTGFPQKAPPEADPLAVRDGGDPAAAGGGSGLFRHHAAPADHIHQVDIAVYHQFHQRQSG